MLPFQLNIFPMKRHRPLPSFSSPRISHDDGTIPTDLKLHAERWSHMSRLAGAHQQDDTVLRIPRTNMAPRSLQSGIPPQLASRIAEVHLGSVTNLPEWLDVLSTHFTNVQHLFLDKDDTTEAGRIRRLYILYRLPHLLTMDGRPVTDLERSLARPVSPNGLPVAQNDWIPEEQEHGDAVHVSMEGVVQTVLANVIPSEEASSLTEPPQRIDSSRDLVQYSKSMESAYRIVKVPSCLTIQTYENPVELADCLMIQQNLEPDEEITTVTLPMTQSHIVMNTPMENDVTRCLPRSISSPFRGPQKESTTAKRSWPPLVPGRTVVAKTTPRWRRTKQNARSGHSMLDEDSTSDDDGEA